MKRRRLPGTDLELTVVGLGCWALGGQYWGAPTTEAEAVATVRAAVEAGVNWVDTAPLYGEGEADRRVVKALGAHLREVVVATKVGVDPHGRDGHAMSDLRPAHVVADAEASLRRLGVERLDLLQVHWPCERGTPLEDTLDALQGLVDQGKVRAFGLCNYDAAGLRRARAWGRFASLQTPYSLLRRELEGPLGAACAEEPPLGVLAYEPLCRGLLSGRFSGLPSFAEDDLRSRDERFQAPRYFHAKALVDDLSRVAAKLGVPTAAVAIGWVASRPGVTAVIAGARTPEQARANARAAALVDHPAVWSVVDRIAAAHGGWR